MIKTNTIDGLSIHIISDMFVAKSGVKSLGGDFFATHDCIHFFTELGVSIKEERIVGQIQLYMLDNKVPSPEAQVYILRLKRKGVYEELKAAVSEAKAEWFAAMSA